MWSGTTFEKAMLLLVIALVVVTVGLVLDDSLPGRTDPSLGQVLKLLAGALVAAMATVTAANRFGNGGKGGS